MAKPIFISATAALVGLTAFSAVPAGATDKDRGGPPHHKPPQPMTCAQLATDPAAGLLGGRFIKSVKSAVVPASGANASFCQVDVLYGTSPEQNINVRVGLPLNSLDGGTGGVQGAWNGRT
ncbi:MAG TPA: hypothetical protein VEN28_16430, partial [Burkholderiaceae bacterium]|nr:hypothetical protein [Burkholderiaceae bacterium]